jgi:hypothetical protein
LIINNNINNPSKVEIGDHKTTTKKVETRNHFSLGEIKRNSGSRKAGRE